MNPRQYWQDYVDRHGGPSGAATRLGLPYSTVAAITNGTRGIGRDLARRMQRADPSIDAHVLVWVEPGRLDDASSPSEADRAA